MTTAMPLSATYNTTYNTTAPAELGDVQATAPAPASSTETSPAAISSQVLSAEPPQVEIAAPVSIADPEDLSIELQKWAASFEVSVVQASKSRLTYANNEVSENLKKSLDKLDEAIKKIKAAKKKARAARMLGIFGKIVGVLLSAVVVALSVAAVVGSAGTATPAVIMGLMAAAAGINALIDLGGEAHAAIHGGQAFSMAGAVGGGWAGVLSANVAQSLVELAKWAEKEQGRELSDGWVIGLTVGLTVAQAGVQWGAMSQVAGATSSLSSATQTASKAGMAVGAVTGGALAIGQGVTSIESARYQVAAEYRRAESVEIEAQIDRIQTTIQDLMRYVQKSTEQLQSATSFTAERVQEWGESMSRFAGNSRKTAAMA